jgi:hypothetical protein
MTADESFSQKACRGALDALLPDKRLPLNVFKDLWSEFFFFESDLIFEPAFISAVNGLLDAEEAQVCCLANLGTATEGESDAPSFKYLDRSTTPEYYMSLLRGNDPPNGWLYWVDRYVCTSDKGLWCIYCEKENDIAVIAIRNKSDTEKFAKALAKLQVSSIEKAYQANEEGEFRFQKLTPSWLSALVAQYPSVSKQTRST